MSSGNLSALLSRAAERRSRIAELTDAFRVVDDAADDLPGVVVDRYAAWAVLSLFTADARERRQELAEALLAAEFRGIYAKERIRADLRRKDREALAPSLPLRGDPAPPELVVREGDARLAVALGEGLSTGLFTDQRDSRRLVRETAQGARVLNLFAYTCSFTVAAALGGAVATTSVDLSQRALARGNRNLQLNGVAGPAHRLLRADALAFLSRARKRGDRYDLVVLDPPSFGTRGKGTFSVERDYARAAEDSLSLLAPGGRLLAVTNHRETTRRALHTLLRAAADRAGVRPREIQDLHLPEDHRHRPNGESPAKAALVHVER